MKKQPSKPRPKAGNKSKASKSAPASMAPALLSGTAPNGVGLTLKTGMTGPGWEVTAFGVVIKKGIAVNDWLDLAKYAIGDFEHARDNYTEALFRVGDTLAAGKLQFEEEWGQAIDAASKSIRLSVKTLSNVQAICGSVAPENRQLMLTIAHHDAVARLVPKEQKHFLKEALEKEWTTSELKAAIKKKHPGTPRKPPATKNIDLDTEEGLHEAFLKVIEWAEAETTPGQDSKGATKINTHPEDWKEKKKALWFPDVLRLLACFAPAEVIAKECAGRAAEYLEHPDNNPIAEWGKKRKNGWKVLALLASAARRLGFEGKDPETPAETPPAPAEEPGGAPPAETAPDENAGASGHDEERTGQE